MSYLNSCSDIDPRDFRGFVDLSATAAIRGALPGGVFTPPIATTVCSSYGGGADGRELECGDNAAFGSVGDGGGSALRPCLSTRALPTFLPDFQDSFTSGPRINVTWLSWLSAVGEIGVSLFSAMRGCECGAGRPSSRPAALAKPSSSSLRPRRSFLSDRQSCPDVAAPMSSTPPPSGSSTSTVGSSTSSNSSRNARDMIACITYIVVV